MEGGGGGIEIHNICIPLEIGLQFFSYWTQYMGQAVQYLPVRPVHAWCEGTAGDERIDPNLSFLVEPLKK